jgi:16S rRNA processing protein RimM
VRGESRLEIGGVARAHGIRGEIVIVTHDPDSDTLGKIESIYVGGVERKILQARDTQRGWLIALDGVATRNDAEALQGQRVEVDRDLLELDDDDVLLDDLIGCEVRLRDGTVWGTVYAVDPGAFQDLLVVHAPAPAPPGSSAPDPGALVERLLPMVDHFIISIDLDAGVVTVDPPEGLPESPVKKR